MVPLPLQTLSPRTGSKEGIVAAHIRVANSPGVSVGSWLGAPSRMALSPKQRRTQTRSHLRCGPAYQPIPKDGGYVLRQ